MKKLLLSLFVVAISANVNAQVKTPAPSPASKLEQQVGLTDVTVEYSRPGMRGRTIFGDLVPYGKVWRTGANQNTKVTFSDDVTIDGKELKKGTYALYTKPNKDSWEVIFYSDANNWGTPRKWDDSKVALSTTAKVEKMPMKIETFTLTIDNIKNSSAVLGMLWENAYVGVKFNTPTDKGVEASIAKIMSGPSAGDYFSSAKYYLDEGKDIQKAKEWINKAVDMTKDRPRFWYLRQQSLILAKAGDKKGAIAAAKASLAGAEKAGNADYVKMNKEFLAKM
ncbi:MULTISPECIES: DUF2911 domain-containing protein [unclassified Tenacibaculum]|uniref:DUF2911 domain-containing protein n=1 Tax=unclassified Tenacibaculum TaxID=2635139 RepID=UPI001F1B4E1B|nr:MULTISPECIES: DUF2911 domain-containing protein [unclassified Tenacibaculum]MCF2873081.1 DUF2911 domain-containing protein [Tenacibaculum sp. Cn5-1]MCF2933237.1 DUF2911 domain-containing protein [Tenacibaculum sp. Cn5-34]MCG7510182.1 DUF2911 domain-containing protein [Tenacibaculum sp. Cn5-46]